MYIRGQDPFFDVRTVEPLKLRRLVCAAVLKAGFGRPRLMVIEVENLCSENTGTSLIHPHVGVVSF